jgi:hypothetical protein
MAEHPERICPHLHVCLQSGSDRILRLMRRRWGVKRFVDRCRLAADMLDEPCFTTDVIVGFPGETDEDFAATCRVVQEVGFREDSHFSVQRATHHARLWSARPGFQASETRACAAARGGRGRTERRVLSTPHRSAARRVGGTAARGLSGRDLVPLRPGQSPRVSYRTGGLRRGPPLRPVRGGGSGDRGLMCPVPNPTSVTGLADSAALGRSGPAQQTVTLPLPSELLLPPRGHGPPLPRDSPLRTG